MSNAVITVHYDRNAPRRPVNLSFNENLIVRAKRLTKNLSAAWLC